MTMILLCIALAFAAVGFFLLLAALYGAPSAKQAAAAHWISHRPKQKKISLEDRAILLVSQMLLKLPLKSQLQSLQTILDNGLLNVSAEIYLARCIVKTLTLMIVSLIGSILMPPIALVALVAPVATYFDARKKVEEVSVKFRTKIEQDLPQFISSILVDISSGDVVRMIRNYLPYAAPELKKELQITVADMESGNYERALLRLDGRVRSPYVSSVVRGLIGITRGNNESSYFTLLSHDIRQAEIARMKQEALKAQPKFGAASMILLLSVLVLIMGILVLDLVASSGQIFY